MWFIAHSILSMKRCDDLGTERGNQPHLTESDEDMNKSY